MKPKLFTPGKFTAKDIVENPFCFPDPEDERQLQADCINVVEGWVALDTYPPDYQQKIKDYYRFTARRQNSKSKNIVKRTNETLDIV